MENKRNIFLQVNTEKVIKAHNDDPTQGVIGIAPWTYIYDQGKMSTGSAVTDFIIDTSTDELFYFTMLPQELFSYHRLYLTGYKIVDPHDIDFPVKVSSFDDAVSFPLRVNNVSAGGYAGIILYGTLEYDIMNTNPPSTEIIKIRIDPVLRANQGSLPHKLSEDENN